MSADAVTLEALRLADGLWEGDLVLKGEFDAVPELKAVWLGQPVDGLTVRPGDHSGRFRVTVRLPLGMVSDGVQTMQILRADTEEVLGRVTLIAGEILADDLRAEVATLRAELDQVKSVLRRHLAGPNPDDAAS